MEHGLPAVSTLCDTAVSRLPHERGSDCRDRRSLGKKPDPAGQLQPAEERSGFAPAREHAPDVVEQGLADAADASADDHGSRVHGENECSHRRRDAFGESRTDAHGLRVARIRRIK